MCVGLLISIFIISFTILPNNPLIGMGELRGQVKEVAIQKGTVNDYCIV